jgi:anti-sigma-K factor RskA
MSEEHTDDLAELRRLGRSASREVVDWEEPPPGLWDKIADSAFGDETAAPVAIESRRRPARVGWWLAAAAAAVVVVAGAVVATRSGSDPAVIAAVDLDQLGETGAGSATLVDQDGVFQLRLAVDDVEAPEGFTEVWLINADLTELISLGPIRADGTYDLPAGLDPTAFPVVDVSFEPFDGDPQHSGDSVLRGQLTF